MAIAGVAIEPPTEPPPPPAAVAFDDSGLDAMRTVQREKLGAEEKLFADTERTLDADRVVMKRAMEQAGVEAERLQPWDAQKNEEKFFSKPIEAFGSLGSVFGILASAFTHAPMENALNASAAAMNAIRGGEEKEYTRAYDAWKENMRLAEQRHKIQQDLFNDAGALMNTDMANGTLKARNLAARFGDKQSLALLDAGMNKEWFELQDARSKAMEGMRRAMDADIVSSARQTMMAGDPDWNTQEQNPAMRAALKLRAFNRYYGKGETLQQEAVGQFLFENPKATAQQIAAFGKSLAVGHETADQEFIRRFYSEHPEATTDDFIKEFGKFKRSQKQGADATINEKALTFMAEQYLHGDKSVLQNLGRGVQGSANVAAFREKVQEMAEQRGITGDKLVTVMAELTGLQSRMRSAGTYGARVDMAAQEVQQLIPQAVEASRALPRGKFVPLNRLIQAFEAGKSDPRYYDFAFANWSLLNAFTRAINPTGVPRLEDKKHTMDIMNTAVDEKSYMAMIERMKKEVAASQRASRNVLQGIDSAPMDIPKNGEGKPEVSGMTDDDLRGALGLK